MASSSPSPATAPSASSISSVRGIRLVPLIALILAVAFALGGGGVRYGLSNLAVQLTALAILAFHREEFLDFWKRAPNALRILVASTLLLPAIQLIPLPEAIWSAMPGRELVVQSRELAGVSGWAPLSVDPARTLVALTGMIVPLVILTVGWSAPRRHLLSVGWIFVLLGLLCVAIGAPQVLSNGADFQFYGERAPSSLLLSTFANRNSTGLYLVSALAMAALLPLPLARPHPAGLPARLGICAVLIAGIILTQSRTALVLSAVPVALGCLRGFAIWRGTNGGRGVGVLIGVFALGVVAVGTLATLSPGRVGDILERFEKTEDARSYIWDDASYSNQRFWPVGAGMGSFDEVIQIDESLESLTERRAGRAHNDFLELSIEAGIIGLILAALWLLLVGWLSWRARQSQFRWAAWASAAILLCIAAQSITDYPLRNQAMLAVAGFAMLLLARIGSVGTNEARA